MRMLPLSLCRPGMKLAKTIFSDDGMVLLAQGKELSASFIKRLGDLGFGVVYIEDPRLEGVEVPELITEETQRKAIAAIRTAFKEFTEQPGRRSSVTYPYVGRSMRQMMSTIMDELSRNRDGMIMLMNMHSLDHYLYSHSLNVCVYSTILGMAYGLENDQLMTLGLGAMLHDIGKTQIPIEVLVKPGKLSDEEFRQIKRHTELGFQLLKDEPNIPLLAAHCAFQHHERLNGTGYPRGLKSDEIHEYAKLIAIADSYDAMTSHRVYRNAMMPHEAVEALYAGSGTLYDTKMLGLFRDKVAIYPIGVGVRLSTGHSAVVVDINSAYAQRPIVRVLTDEHGTDLREPYDMDLSKHLSVMVAEIEFERRESNTMPA
ncbi:HD-GYP domain-containing protein [Cohnella pontilimi]|uniref:HD-GYP domain-containing protein n=1 Tax=Cohnella pontilimi TaxID=2564100 RepID=A0A4U0F9R0_9BACL|nr:HD-GYP domain-containing protein [Cohnella pontilimi]TJY41496.1 HD-GYP domain-containing protein [Cohnella pontilimi]